MLAWGSNKSHRDGNLRTLIRHASKSSLAGVSSRWVHRGQISPEAGSYAIFFGVILKRRKSDFPRAQNHNTSQLPAHLMVILIFFCLFCFGEGFVELQEA